MCGSLLTSWGWRCTTSPAFSPGGGAILVSLSPHLAGACLCVFSVLWVVTVIYGAYSRHSQRVVQASAPVPIWGGGAGPR
jgi:hypothetical protein